MSAVGCDSVIRLVNSTVRVVPEGDEDSVDIDVIGSGSRSIQGGSSESETPYSCSSPIGPAIDFKFFDAAADADPRPRD